MSKSGGFFRKLMLVFKKVGFYGALALIATLIAMYFGVNVPVLSGIVRWILGLFGI